MPKVVAPLTIKQLEKITRIGYTAVGGDAHGLNLALKESGLRSWSFRYSLNGKRREMGLGRCDEITLQDARRMAVEARDLICQGIDPIEYRAKAQAKNITDNENKYCIHSFSAIAKSLFEIKKVEWKNPKHRDQWINSLTTYAFPFIGDKDVSEINVQDVKSVLAPIWLAKHETATRVRSRIENVIDHAISCDYRNSANPASNKALKSHLPKSSRIRETKHHNSLPYEEVSTLFKEIFESQSVSRQALIFTILTAKRSNEVRGAIWSEIDFSTGLWTIPKERMKNKKMHREPLSEMSINFLRILKAKISDFNSDSLIFKSSYKGVKLSDMALLEALKHLRPGYTVHGFRSTFRQWAAEKTNHGHHTCEMALAHTVLTSVESAYQRSDLLDKRRVLMEDWAKFLDGHSDENMIFSNNELDGSTLNL